MNTNKLPGPDYITSRDVQELTDSINALLIVVYNLSSF